MDEFIDGALMIADSPCGADQNARNAGHEQPVVRVIVEDPMIARDSNRSKKNYAMYAMTSKEIFFNTPVAKQAKTRQVPIMWMNKDEE